MTEQEKKQQIVTDLNALATKYKGSFNLFWDILLKFKDHHSAKANILERKAKITAEEKGLKTFKL